MSRKKVRQITVRCDVALADRMAAALFRVMGLLKGTENALVAAEADVPGDVPARADYARKLLRARADIGLVRQLREALPARGRPKQSASGAAAGEAPEADDRSLN